MRGVEGLPWPHLASGEFGHMEPGRLASMTATEKWRTNVDLIGIQADDEPVSEVWLPRNRKWELDRETETG